MSEWQDRFEQHGIHTTFKELDELVSSAELPTDDPTEVASFQRVVSVFQYARSRLQCADFSLVLPQALDQMAGLSANLRDHLKNFLANGNAAQLKNANSHADQLLANVTTLPFPLPREADTFVSASKQLSRLSSDLIADLKSQADEAIGQMKQLTQEMNNADKRLGQHDQTLEQQKARMDSVISDLQKQFSDGEERRRMQFESATNERTTAFQNTQDELDERVQAFLDSKTQESTELRDSLRQKGDALLQELEVKRKEASELLHVIGNIGVTGQYDNHAISDRKAADRWRRIAISFMSALVLGAIITVSLAFLKDEPDWKMTLVRMFTSLTFAIPAFYAARESQRHRRMEQRYRKLQLELASLDPFLEKLPESKRHELKEKLTERFFGQPEPPEKDEEPVTSGTLFDLLKMVLQNLTKK